MFVRFASAIVLASTLSPADAATPTRPPSPYRALPVGADAPKLVWAKMVNVAGQHVILVDGLPAARGFYGLASGGRIIVGASGEVVDSKPASITQLTSAVANIELFQEPDGRQPDKP